MKGLSFPVYMNVEGHNKQVTIQAVVHLTDWCSPWLVKKLKNFPEPNIAAEIAISFCVVLDESGIDLWENLAEESRTQAIEEVLSFLEREERIAFVANIPFANGFEKISLEATVTFTPHNNGFPQRQVSDVTVTSGTDFLSNRDPNRALEQGIVLMDASFAEVERRGLDTVKVEIKGGVAKFAAHSKTYGFIR